MMSPLSKIVSVPISIRPTESTSMLYFLSSEKITKHKIRLGTLYEANYYIPVREKEVMSSLSSVNAVYS